MEEDKIHLLIVSQEKTLFEGQVKSSLDAGEVVYRSGKDKICLNISGGFVEVNDKTVSVCVTEATA